MDKNNSSLRQTETGARKIQGRKENIMSENKNIELKALSENELNEITGGADGKVGLYEGPWKTVCNLQTGWLAIRTAPCYDYTNEIGQLYNGDSVQIIGNGSGNGYIWVWAPRINKSGWVNENFIG